MVRTKIQNKDNKIYYKTSKEDKIKMKEYYNIRKETVILCAYCKSLTNLFSINKHLRSKKCLDMQQIKNTSDVNFKDNYKLYLEYVKKCYKLETHNDNSEDIKMFINRLCKDIKLIKNKLGIDYNDEPNYKIYEN